MKFEVYESEKLLKQEGRDEDSVIKTKYFVSAQGLHEYKEDAVANVEEWGFRCEPEDNAEKIIKVTGPLNKAIGSAKLIREIQPSEIEIPNNKKKWREDWGCGVHFFYIPVKIIIEGKKVGATMTVGKVGSSDWEWFKETFKIKN